MSEAEIIAELPKLSFDERQKILACLCDLQDRDLISGAGLSSDLKELLDDELEEYERDGGAGQPWSEVLAELRAKAPR
jgi:hypothetical protein